MYWCDVVEKAERFIWLLAKAQGLWQYQEIPMTSLLLEEKHPSNFAYFKLIRYNGDVRGRRPSQSFIGPKLSRVTFETIF
jgi:hypothetical protein